MMLATIAKNGTEKFVALSVFYVVVTLLLSFVLSAQSLIEPLSIERSLFYAS